MPICACNVPLRTNPGNDWLKLQCRSCGSCFCFSCGRAPHFPALCREAMEWNAVDNPSVRECQRQWNLLNQQLNTVRFLKNSYEEHEDPAFFALFYGHPDLRCAIREGHLKQRLLRFLLLELRDRLELLVTCLIITVLLFWFGLMMEAIIEIFRWLSVIYKRNPQVADFQRHDYESLEIAFTDLVASFPLPGAEEAGHLNARRLSASLSVSRVLANLYRVRLAITPLELMNAAVVPFDAIQNHLEVVPPLTLLELDAPLGEKIDVSYLALLHLEKILWQFKYHQMHN